MADNSNPNPQGGDGNPPSTPDPTEGFRKLLERHANDGVRLAETLYGENHKLREKLRNAEGKAPGDNDVVLKGDDIKRWNTYRDLGEPTDLRKAVEQRDQYKAESERNAREKEYGAAAKVAGFVPDAFVPLAERDGLQLVTKEERSRDTGKVGPVVHVKGVDADGKESLTPLSTYAEERWAVFLPSLKAGATPPPRPVGTPPPRSLNTPPPRPGAADDEDLIYRETLAHGNYSRY